MKRARGVVSGARASSASAGGRAEGARDYGHVAPLLLRTVERGIARAEKLTLRARVVGARRDADAYRHNPKLVERACRDGQAQALSCGGCLLAADAREQQRELFAA